MDLDYDLAHLKALAGLNEATEPKEAKEGKPAGKKEAEKLDFSVSIDKSGAPKVDDELKKTKEDTGSGKSDIPKPKLGLKEAFDTIEAAKVK